MSGAGDLPTWPPGTAAVLSTGGGPPHAIPVSTAVRAGPRRVLLALARGRASLARLRSDPSCALTVLAAGTAFTAHGRASVVEDPMAISDGVVAVAIEVDDVQSHDDPRFAIDAGVDWHWTDAAAADRDAAIHEALRALAG
jgi:pyridoxamine 5'-phosphate oxidase-like protein